MPGDYIASRGFDFAEVIDWAVIKSFGRHGIKAAFIK
jgi:hypothetical protein